MKKIFLFVFTLALIFPSTTFAIEPNEEIVPYGAGEWDVLLDGSIYASTTGTKAPSVTSGGGDIRVCTSGIDPRNSINVNMSKTSGTPITNFFFVNNNSTESALICLPKFDIRPYVDSTGKVNLNFTVSGVKPDVIRIVVED